MSDEKKLIHIWGFLWCLPLSVPFWILCGLAYLLRQVEWFEANDDLTFVWEFRRDSFVGKRLFLNRGWAGFGCGNAIMLVSLDSRHYERTVRHERMHCYQSYCCGIFFPLVYILLSLCVYMFYPELHSYYDNPFEKQARRYAGQQVDISRASWKDGDRWIWW